MPPLYEYTCPRGHRFELQRKMDERNEPSRCTNTCDASQPHNLHECGRPGTLAVSVPAHAQVDGGTGAGLGSP